MAPREPAKFRGFLSYSHADRAVGEKLHAAIEEYVIPPDLVGKAGQFGPVPAKLRPIFRDRYDTEAGHSLKEQIVEALEKSEALIVLCSTASAKSSYVNEEIRIFKKLGRAKRIFPIIIGGEPGHPELECFPSNLRRKPDSAGELTEDLEEPLASDARPGGDGQDLALQKLVAGIIGVDLDTLRQREALYVKRQRRFWIGVSAAMALLAVAAGASAVVAWMEYHQKSAALAKNERLTATLLQRASSLVDKSVATTDEFGVPARVGLKILEEADGIFRDMDRLGTTSKELGIGQVRMLLTMADSLARIGKVPVQQAKAEEARKLADSLLVQFPDDIDLIHLRADTLLRIGHVFSTRREVASALQAYGAALEERTTRLGGIKTSNKEHLTALSTLHNAIAVAHNRRSEPTDALVAAELSAEAADRLAAAGASVAEVAEKRVPALIVIADTQRQLRRRDEALATVAEGLLAVENVLASAADNVPWLRRKSHLYLIRGDVERSRDHELALKHYQECLAIRERLAAYDPQNATLSSEESFARIKIGEELRSLGRLEASAVEFQKATDAYAAIIKLNPDHQIAARQMIDALDGLGEVKRLERNQPARLAVYQQRKAVALRLRESDPDNRDAVRTLATSETLLGNAHLEQEDPATAATFYQNALTLLRGLSKPSLGDERDLGEALEKLGIAYRDRNKYPEAEAALTEALAIRRAHSERPNPTDGARLRYAYALQEMGETKLVQNAVSDAIELARTSIAIRKSLLNETISDENRRLLAVALELAGRGELVQGHAKAALADFEESLPIRIALRDRAKSPQQDRNLAETWRLIAEAKLSSEPCAAKDGYATARELFATAVAGRPDNLDWKSKLSEVDAALITVSAACQQAGGVVPKQ